MPITPHFHLSQTPTTITITIHVPHVRVSAATIELIVDGPVVHFYSAPYLLRLTFPGNLIDDNSDDNGREAKAKYDPCLNDGTLIVEIHKEEEGLWDDLDLIGRLMSPKKMMTSRIAAAGGEGGGSRRRVGAGIEVIASSFSSGNNDQQQDVNDDDEEEGDADHDGNQKEEEVHRENLLPASLGEMTSSTQPLNAPLQRAPRYGFLNMHSGVYESISRDGLASEMLELSTLNEIPSKETRRMRRLQKENEKFNSNRYLDDLLLGDQEEEEGECEYDYIYEEAVKLIPHWIVERERNKNNKKPEINNGTKTDEVGSLITCLSNLTTNDDNDNKSVETSEGQTSPRQHQQQQQQPMIDYFTPEESHLLATISNNTLSLPSNISPRQTQSLLLGLLDLLFAYVYDHRITSSESTVESSWTLSTLSPTLSWLEEYDTTAATTTTTTVNNNINNSTVHSNYHHDGNKNIYNDSIQSVLRYCIRRSLIYPYIRNYTFARNKCCRDVACVVRNGRRCIIRCLLQVQRILEKSEVHYLNNKLYVNPYVMWIQQFRNEEILTNFAREVWEVVMIDEQSDARSDDLGKGTLGLNLLELERLLLESGGDGDEEEEEEGEVSETRSVENDYERSLSEEEDCSDEEGENSREEEEDGDSVSSSSRKSSNGEFESARVADILEASVPSRSYVSVLETSQDSSKNVNGVGNTIEVKPIPDAHEDAPLATDHIKYSTELLDSNLGRRKGKVGQHTGIPSSTRGRPLVLVVDESSTCQDEENDCRICGNDGAGEKSKPRIEEI